MTNLYSFSLVWRHPFPLSSPIKSIYLTIDPYEQDFGGTFCDSSSSAATRQGMKVPHPAARLIHFGMPLSHSFFANESEKWLQFLTGFRDFKMYFERKRYERPLHSLDISWSILVTSIWVFLVTPTTIDSLPRQLNNTLYRKIALSIGPLGVILKMPDSSVSCPPKAYSSELNFLEKSTGAEDLDPRVKNSKAQRMAIMVCPAL